MAPKITLYVSSVSGNLKIKNQQSRIQMILDSKKVQYEWVDVAADEDAKEEMKEKSGKSLIPQIFVNGEFKGGFEEFDAATEDGNLNEFFGLDSVF